MQIQLNYLLILVLHSIHVESDDAASSYPYYEHSSLRRKTYSRHFILLAAQIIGQNLIMLIIANDQPTIVTSGSQNWEGGMHVKANVAFSLGSIGCVRIDDFVGCDFIGEEFFLTREGFAFIGVVLAHI